MPSPSQRTGKKHSLEEGAKSERHFNHQIKKYNEESYLSSAVVVAVC